jgi:hypothetical protein
MYVNNVNNNLNQISILVYSRKHFYCSIKHEPFFPATRNTQFILMVPAERHTRIVFGYTENLSFFISPQNQWWFQVILAKIE